MRIASLVFGLSAALATAQCDPQWATTAPFAGVDGSVRCSTLWDPDGPGPADELLVLGGTFGTAGPTTSANVVGWNPQTGEWVAIPGLAPPIGPIVTAQVLALAVLPNGNLVAGGVRLFGPGFPNDHIAIFDGTSWQVPGAGLDGGVADLAVSNGELVACGSFRNSGATAVNGIARFDGVAWQPYGSGLEVSAVPKKLLAHSGGELFVCGAMASVDAVPVVNLARFDGVAWHAVPGIGDIVEDITEAANGDLLVCGRAGVIDSDPWSYFGRWDGATWDSWGVPSLVFSTRFENIVELTNGDLLAAQTYQSPNEVYRWDGLAWSSAGSDPAFHSIQELAALPNGRALLGGQWSHRPGMHGAAIWDAGDWQPLVSGTDGHPRALSASPSGELVVGGYFGTIEEVAANMIAQRDNGSWLPLGDGFDLTVNAVGQLPDGDIVAGGVFTASGATTTNHLAIWDGSTWSELGGGVDGNVNGMLIDGGDVIVAGAFGSAGGVACDGIARWDGTTWQALGQPLAYASGWTLERIALFANGDVLASGNHLELARWDGATWTAFGGGVATRNAHVLANGDVVAMNAWQLGTGTQLPPIARFDGVAWTAVGTGLYPTAKSPVLELPNGDLLTIGRLHPAQWQPYHLARFDGVAWSSLGEISNVASMALLPNGEIWLAGEFYGGNAEYGAGIAYLTPPCTAEATSFGANCSPVAFVAESGAWIGSNFRSTATGLGIDQLAVLARGVAPVAIPVASLLPAGAFGCDLLVDPVELALVVPTAGVASFELALPSAAALVGLDWIEQVAVVALDAAGIASVQTTNALQLTIGGF